MREYLKKILLRLGLLAFVRNHNVFNSKSVKENKRKQKIVINTHAQSTATIFIETGTYLGDMVDAVKNRFERVYSIELSPTLYQNAVERFKGDNTVTILNGDSGALLVELLEKITEPVLFWLDAHYSAGITARGDLDTPILKELEVILGHQNKSHVILIDDARLFTGTDGYPTLETVQDFVNKSELYQMVVADDIIKVYPK